MSSAEFVFYGELNDFLPQYKRHQPINLMFNGKQSAKHLIESLGIPHPEIGKVYVNEHLSGLGYHVNHLDRIEVYPQTPEERCGGEPAQIRFILDNHLGKLATYLRIFGFDVVYDNSFQDARLAIIAVDQGLTLLTRDRRLLMRSSIISGYCVRADLPPNQVAEVVERFGLQRHINPFHRCLRCNHPLTSIHKESIINRLQPLTKRYFDEFYYCQACDQIYWQGSHYEKMLGLIADITQNIPVDPD